VCQGLLIIEASRSHPVALLWTSYQPDAKRPLPHNTYRSQETDTHAPGGIRTYNPIKREAADPRLRPRGHSERLVCISTTNDKLYCSRSFKCATQ